MEGCTREGQSVRMLELSRKGLINWPIDSPILLSFGVWL